ncbi:MAG TPA: TetR/AcrR family transcriptional regulator [Gammaproteobacteria bacterium]|jgi:AcrR family transcriptional regulator|nr:TetR/AcrR family transcriptional regulator [Gammaproteobacteria bacterium]
MGRRRQVSDEQISLAAREVFLERGPKAPVAMVAKKLGVSTATLFQRTGSKQQLMLMALQPETTAINELDRGVQTDVPVRDQLVRILVEINEYLGTIIGGSITLRAALIEAELPEPTPYQVRALLAQWLVQAHAAKLLDVDDARTTAEVLIGTLEARHIHAYMQQEQLSSKQHREFIRAMLGVVFPERG